MDTKRPANNVSEFQDKESDADGETRPRLSVEESTDNSGSECKRPRTTRACNASIKEDEEDAGSTTTFRRHQPQLHQNEDQPQLQWLQLTEDQVKQEEEDVGHGNNIDDGHDDGYDEGYEPVPGRYEQAIQLSETMEVEEEIMQLQANAEIMAGVMQVCPLQTLMHGDATACAATIDNDASTKNNKTKKHTPPQKTTTRTKRSHSRRQEEDDDDDNWCPKMPMKIRGLRILCDDEDDDEPPRKRRRRRRLTKFKGYDCDDDDDDAAPRNEPQDDSFNMPDDDEEQEEEQPPNNSNTTTQQHATPPNNNDDDNGGVATDAGSSNGNPPAHSTEDEEDGEHPPQPPPAAATVGVGRKRFSDKYQGRGYDGRKQAEERFQILEEHLIKVLLRTWAFNLYNSTVVPNYPPHLRDAVMTMAISNNMPKVEPLPLGVLKSKIKHKFVKKLVDANRVGLVDISKNKHLQITTYWMAVESVVWKCRVQELFWQILRMDIQYIPNFTFGPMGMDLLNIR